MPLYTDFWQSLLREFNSELDPAQPLEKTYRNSGLENIGNRKSYSGYLEVFGCAVRNHTNSQVFRDLAEVVKKNGHIKTKLTGLLRVSVDKNSILTFSYQPFSWELMMNRYRDYQDKTQMAEELYKWKLVQEFQELWRDYDAGKLSFKELMQRMDLSNLAFGYFKATFKAVVNEKPNELEKAFRHLYDTAIPLQKRIDSFRDAFEELFDQVKADPKHTAQLSEREIATFLTYRYPERYTFFIASFYSILLKAIGRSSPKKWRQLTDYYELVYEFKRDVLPKYEDAVAVKNRLTQEKEYYPDDEHLLLVQDIFYVTLMEGVSHDDVEPDEPTCSYWIFQGSPELYDLKEAFENDLVRSWNARAHRDRMQPGDKVIFWMTGEDAGCYALGEITSKPYQKSEQEIGDELWKGEDPGSWKVEVQITHNLVDNPITKKHINNIPELQYLKVGNRGTNFSATEVEYEKIKAMAENQDEPRYWLFAPGESAYKWDDFYNSGTIGLGWDELGDLSNYDSKDEIAQSLRKIYGSKTSRSNDAYANWQFVHDISPGDFVIVKKGRWKLLGLGRVVSNYYWDNQIEEYRNRRKVEWLRKGEWDTDHSLALKTLTDITDYPQNDGRFNQYYEKLLFLMEENSQDQIPELSSPVNKIFYGPPGTGKTYKLKNEYFQKYTGRETSISAAQHFEEVAKDLSWWQVVALALLETGEAKVAQIKSNRWVAFKARHSESKNVHATLWGTLQAHTVEESQTVSFKQRFPPLIFDKSTKSLWKIQHDLVEEQVPELLEIKNSVDNYRPNPDKIIKRYVFTTFHQSFAYEDFIEGIKPKLQGKEEGEVEYHIAEGVFKRLCSQASLDADHRYAIFIDEINRGNIANIFGELITLIEKDKRKGCENEISVELPYSKKQFSVPANVDIYGTMNTADRSVEALDTALRRRFTFEEMMPNVEIIKEELGYRNDWNGFKISEILQTINERIEVLVDRDHLIGHAYFLSLATAKDFEGELRSIFTDKVIPLLQEYFYNDYVKIGMVMGAGFVKISQSEHHKFAAITDSLETEYEDRKLYRIVPADELDLKDAFSRLMNHTQNEQTEG